MAPNWKTYSEKLAIRANSLIARLSEVNFEAGMAKVRAHAAQTDPTEEVSEGIDFFVFKKPKD